MVAFNDDEIARVASDPIAHSLDDLRQACDDAAARLRAAHGWPDTDGRVVAIHRLRNVTQSLLAAFVFHRVAFPAATFWQAFFQAVPAAPDMANHYREFDVLVRFAGLQGMFSAVESDLRTIVSAMDSNACGGATAEFSSIVAWLLARAKSAAAFATFADLIRLTRNTIHTNGVHRPRSGQDTSLVIAGRTYNFVVGQPVDFVDWAFVVFMGQQLLTLVETISTDPVVRVLPNV